MDDIGGHVVDGASGGGVLPAEYAAEDGDSVTDLAAQVETENDRYARFDVGQDGGGNGGIVGVRVAEAERLVAGLGDRADHALGGEEVRPGGQRDRLVRGSRGGEPRDVGHRDPVVAVSGVQVAHAGPNGDLGAGAHTGVLLQIRGSGDLEIYSEQVGVEGGTACDGGLHVPVSPQTGV